MLNPLLPHTESYAQESAEDAQENHPHNAPHDTLNEPHHNDPHNAHEDPIFEEIQSIFAAFFEGFGFKANLGRIWSTLFYQGQPMSQREIGSILQLSAGMVSQGLAELSRFGMVATLPQARGRETLYQCERNLLKIVASILRQREQQIIHELRQRIDALKLRLALLQPLPDATRQRLESLEEVLVICQLGSAIIDLVEGFSDYSHHAISLGARAIAHLRVAQLPSLLDVARIPFQRGKSRPTKTNP